MMKNINLDIIGVWHFQQRKGWKLSVPFGILCSTIGKCRLFV